MFIQIKRLIIISLLLNLIVLQYSNAKTVTIKGASTYGSVVYPAIVDIDMSTNVLPKIWQLGDPIKEIPMVNNKARGSLFTTAAERGFGEDPLAIKQHLNQNNSFASLAFDSTIINVDGASFTGVNPSDTNGDIGNNYYVQSINNSSSSIIFIINKDNGTLATQFVLDTLAAGSGTGCGGGRGDPVVFFDQLAPNGAGEANGKWVLTEFTSNSFCVYVSQTSDPTSGSWFIYEFSSDSGGLPDYPKFGNWNDAYYIGANEGPTNYALDKANMIIGAAARPAQFFIGTDLPGFGFQHFMPADTDGTIAPPAGAPGIFMRHRDGDYHDNGNLPDVLEMYEFKVDWNNAANSTFTGPINIPVSEFDTNLGGTNFGDLSVVQPGGATNLFPLKQPLMWRLQHRTIANKQYIVGNMVTDVDGNDLHGVRWFQLERPAATTIAGWSLADEGTYTLGDNVNRWMASTAMDGDGNIAIGYNVSNSSTFPGMRYAGRLASDTPGTMPSGEHSIIEGTASNSSSRWGDYSSLSVDPVDECTFWYTAQYNTSGNWSTRIASFKFDECGGNPPANNPPTASFNSNCIGLNCNFDASASSDSDGTIASYSWSFGGSGANASNTYASAGLKSVTLTVTDNDGATDTETKSITVTSPPGNVLTNGVAITGISGTTNNQKNYTLQVPSGTSNLTFNLSGGTGDADLYIKFGSPPTLSSYDCRPFIGGNNENCPISNVQTGTYHVMIVAFSTYSGASLVASYSTSTPNVAPNASFTSNCTNLTCSFNASGSSDSDGSISNYSWSFGGSGVTASNTYANTGTFTVTLTVTDNDGATDSLAQSVTVTAPPTGGGSFFENTSNVNIPDNNPTGATSNLNVTRTGASGNIRVTYSIVHTYIGDLKVEIFTPTGETAVLRDGTGGSANNVNESKNLNAGTIEAFGNWRLKVTDDAGADTGFIDSWSVEFL